MISQANLHKLTDYIGKQIETLRTNIGGQVSTVAGSPSTIEESLWNSVNMLAGATDIASLSSLQVPIENIQSSIDWENIARTHYVGFIRQLNSYLLDSDTVTYNGFSKFGLDNSGTRYCSEFCRLLKLIGFVLVSDGMCFYDQTDTLGTYVVGGAGQGSWTASDFDWDDPEDTYGVQPTSGIEAEAKTQIGASDIDISVNALNATSAIGTTESLTGDYDDYVKTIISVTVSGGTAADEFYIRWNPVRDIIL